MNKKLEGSAESVSRVQFLQGDFSGKHVVLRPPWSIEEQQFVALCTSCGDCIDHCPTTILRKGRAGYPVVDFHFGECDFCGECVNHCRTGALQPSQYSVDDSSPWALKAQLGDNCLALNNVVCRTCAEQCEARAIEFHLSAGRVPRPELAVSNCNGCGACYAPCPVNAITFYMSES